MKCTHCKLGFEDHNLTDDGSLAMCPNGNTSFDVVFQANPEAIEFVKQNLDKTPKELADLWVEKLRNKDA